jgi:hypothetical protein
MFDLVCAQKIFLFGSSCTLHDLDGAMTSPSFDMTSSRPYAYTSIGGLRDMGTHGSPPTRVPEVPAKWTRPVRSPTNLQVYLETLSTTPTTLEDSRRPYLDPGRPTGLVAQGSPLGRGSALPVGPHITGFTL